MGSHRGRCIALASRPDGHRLASAGADRTIQLWDIAGKEAPTILSAREEVFALAFSPDGFTLASAGEDSDFAVTLWNLRTPSELSPRRMLGHKQQINGLSYSPDGRFLVSVSHDLTAGSGMLNLSANLSSCAAI